MIPGQVFGSLSREQHPQNLSLCHHGSDHSVSPAEQNPWPHTAPDFSPVLRLSIQIQMSSKLQTLARVSAVRNVVLFLPHMLGPTREAGSEPGTRFGDIDWLMKQFYGCSHIYHVNSRSQISGVLSDREGPVLVLWGERSVPCVLLFSHQIHVWFRCLFPW